MTYHVDKNSKDGLSRRNNRIAFTLSEVLITLGIIGIVAALTLPSFITKYKRHELENRFKRTSSLIETALRNTVNEFSLDDCAYYPKNTIYCHDVVSDDTRIDSNNYFIKQFNVVKVSPRVNNITLYRFNGDIDNNGYQTLMNNFATGYPNWVGYILTDGTFISPIRFQTHGNHDGLKVVFDTNGPFKGPNRYGYDVFIYDSGYWNASDCGGNYDYGCYKYAQADENPEDKAKGYWDSLEF